MRLVFSSQKHPHSFKHSPGGSRPSVTQCGGRPPWPPTTARLALGTPNSLTFSLERGGGRGMRRVFVMDAVGCSGSLLLLLGSVNADLVGAHVLLALGGLFEI